MSTNGQSPQLQQEAERQQLQAHILAVKDEAAATVEALVQQQVQNILGQSENAALREDIARRRCELVHAQIGTILRRKQV